MFTLAFWKAATERAAKSGAQFTLLTITGGLIAGGASGETAEVVNAFALDYVTLGGVFAGGVIVSYLTSVVSSAVTSAPGPSLTSAETIK